VIPLMNDDLEAAAAALKQNPMLLWEAALRFNETDDG
jgi:hypothetical protein